MNKTEFSFLKKKTYNKTNDLKENFLSNNIVYTLTNITRSYYSSIKDFLSVYNNLDKNIFLNNKPYISEVQQDWEDQSLFFSITTLNTELISMLSSMSCDTNKDQDLLEKFLLDINSKSLLIKKQKYYFNEDEYNIFFNKKFNNYDECLSYIQNNFHQKSINFNDDLYFFKLLLKQEHNTILNLISKYIETNILENNFLEKNYESQKSFIHSLCSNNRYDTAYELIKKYNFPIQYNCDFLSQINNFEYASKFIKDFEIDLYNSKGKLTIIQNDDELLTPYEIIVSSSNPFKSQILAFAAKQSQKDNESLNIFAVKEFTQLVQSKKSKKEIIEYIDNNYKKLVYLNKTESNILDSIKSNYFWWLYPILIKNNVLNIKDKKGFNFLNSTILDMSDVKYENIFYNNFSLMINKDLIVDSNSQFKDIFNNILNAIDNNFSYIKNPIVSNKNEKNTFKDSNYLNSFAPFRIYPSNIYNKKLKSNKCLDIIYDFISQENIELQQNIAEVTQDIENLYTNESIIYRCSLKQAIFYFYCTHQYAQDYLPLIDFKNLDIKCFTNHQLDSNTKNSIQVLNEIKINALLENIIVVTKYFPESIGTQEYDTLIYLQKILLDFFKSNNAYSFQNKVAIEDIQLKIINEILEVSQNFDCEFNIVHLEELQSEIYKFFNNTNIKTDSLSTEYKKLKSLFESQDFNNIIPKANNKTVKTIKF